MREIRAIVEHAETAAVGADRSIESVFAGRAPSDRQEALGQIDTATELLEERSGRIRVRSHRIRR